MTKNLRKTSIEAFRTFKLSANANNIFTFLPFYPKFSIKNISVYFIFKKLWYFNRKIK